MNPRDVIAWLIKTLNIKDIDKLTVYDLEEELVQLAKKSFNLAEFRQFIKDCIKNDTYAGRMKTKLEIYYLMVQDFENSKTQLLPNEKSKLRAFTDQLAAKTVFVFHNIKDYIELDKGSIHDDYVKFYLYEKFNDFPKELEILKKFGNKEKLFNYFNKLSPDVEKFKEILFGIACDLELRKRVPSYTAIENNNTINKLQSK